MITQDRKANWFLVHVGRDVYGFFQRIVAGSKHHTMDRAAEAMRQHGCEPTRDGHFLLPANEVSISDYRWATFYSCYTLD